jgi:hypothetical protein
MNIADWFSWIRYLSYLTYSLSALAKLEFTYGDPFESVCYDLCHNASSLMLFTVNVIDQCHCSQPGRETCGVHRIFAIRSYCKRNR